MEPFTLVTSCASTRATIPRVRVGNMTRRLTMQQALDQWMEMLGVEEPSYTPRELYRGLGFITLTKIADMFKPQAVKIVTGGLGLTDIDEKIIPYDFTASPKEPENICQVVTAEPFVQTMWWRLINERRGHGRGPVGRLIEEAQGMVIIACSKIFLRYISDDVLGVGYEHRRKVKILLAASSQGSVPAQLRPMMIPFDREFISDMPGNRNDNNHRAAYRFLELCAQDEGFANADTATQRQAFMHIPGQQGLVVPVPRTNLEEFLRARPAYIRMRWEDAYKLTRRELGTVGGKMHFRSVLRRLQGGGVVQQEVDPAKLDAAKNALVGIGFAVGGVGGNGGGENGAEEEEVLAVMRVFVSALRQVFEGAIFTAADVCKWAASYRAEGGNAIPDAFEGPSRLTFILKANYSVLGLEEVSVGSGKGYTIRKVEENRAP